jgi:AraC family transcriptional regulator, arabinose operon regulatory protein
MHGLPRLNNNSPGERARTQYFPSYGSLAATARDHVYFPSAAGHIYTCPYICTDLCAPFTAVILLTACGGTFEVEIAGCVHTQAAATLKSVPRRVKCRNVELVIVHLNPLHPDYRTIQRIYGPGLYRLERSAYSHLDAGLRAAYDGTLGTADAKTLFDAVVAATIMQLPRSSASDPRADALIGALRQNPHRSLQSLAVEFHLSYAAMSRAFTAATGISFRQYQLWRKLENIRYVYRPDKSLTEMAHDAGFSDLAHMTRVFQRAYGAPPSYFLRNSSVTRFPPSYRPARKQA